MAQPVEDLLIPAMTRCECGQVPFEKVKRACEAGKDLDRVRDELNCGRTCGACVPDLMDFLRP